MAQAFQAKYCDWWTWKPWIFDVPLYPDEAVSSFQCQRDLLLVLEVMGATISCFDVHCCSFLLLGYLLLHTKTQYSPLNLAYPVKQKINKVLWAQLMDKKFTKILKKIKRSPTISIESNFWRAGRFMWMSARAFGVIIWTDKNQIESKSHHILNSYCFVHLDPTEIKSTSKVRPLAPFCLAGTNSTI